MARAAIYGIAGTVLSADERAFLAEADPWGFILFARNVESPDQLARLTGDLRATVGWQAPILIDQEGGRVARMRAPHWREWPPVRDDCRAGPDALGVLERLSLRYRLIAAELHAVGIDVNCVPLLDLPQLDAHPIIGNRALGETPDEVALRARECCEALLSGGVLPVIKHLPGHGRALHDSHEALPTVTVPRAELRHDLTPFRALRDQVLGMTAHVVYSAIDPERPATLSPAAIGVIRDEIGFHGLLMTDDLSMKALSGPMRSRAEASLAAGCDVALHCNGDMAEMQAVAEAAPELAGPSADRAVRAEAARRSPEPFDIAAADARYAELAGGMAA